MKINKNTTLAFVGGVLLASSASMFAATNITTDNTIDSMSMGATSTNRHDGMKSDKMHLRHKKIDKVITESELAARVASGKITQAQADKIKLRMTNMASNTQMRHEMKH